MRTRGLNFLDQWMAGQLRERASDDPIIISDVAHKAMVSSRQGMRSTTEISEEVPSVFEVIAEALIIARAASLTL